MLSLGRGHTNRFHNFCISAVKVNTAEAFLSLVSQNLFLSTALCPTSAEVGPSSGSSPDMKSISPVDSGRGDSTNFS